jgi:TonB family protein
MSLGLLLEGAVRALLLGFGVFAILRVMRCKSPRQVWMVWVFALVASLVMVASMRSVPLPIIVDVSQEIIRAVPHGVVKGAPRRDLFALVATLYATVASLLCLRLLVGLLLSARLRRQAQPVQVPGGLDARISARIATPVTFGRTILLPTDFAFWSIEKRRAVLAHEQAHVRWFDFHVQILAQLHCALLWFSPFSWWLQAELRELAEQASDEEAITAVGDKQRYAEILFEVAQRARPVPFAVAMARTASVERRVDQILRHEPRTRRRISWPILALLALTAFAASSIAPQARVAAEPQQMVRAPGAGTNPLYPQRAQDEKIEGFANFRVTIDASGKPMRVELVDETPAGYGFGESARRAIETWMFKNDDGKARTGSYRLTFRLK